jgi:hypothetical protein
MSQEKIRTIAESIVNGEIGIVEGVRILVQNQNALGLPEQDVLTLIGIESETDDIPIGEIRLRWSDTALKEKDAEKDLYEEKVKDQVVTICKKMIH